MLLGTELRQLEPNECQERFCFLRMKSFYRIKEKSGYNYHYHRRAPASYYNACPTDSVKRARYRRPEGVVGGLSQYAVVLGIPDCQLFSLQLEDHPVIIKVTRGLSKIGLDELVLILGSICSIIISVF